VADVAVERQRHRPDEGDGQKKQEKGVPPDGKPAWVTPRS
jgi:hypothetical protein